MSEAVKNLFTDISGTYDKLNHFLSFNFDKSWRKKTIAQIHKRSDDSFNALDLCAGTHDMGIECLRQFPNSQITAADFSEAMLTAGENKIRHYIASGKIKPVCADALHMPFADASFDVVFCAYGVRNFDNTETGMKEIYRVLKPGGQVLILEFFKPSSFLSLFFNKTYGEHVLPRIGFWISKHPSAYQYLRDSIRAFLTLEEFNHLLEKIKFKNVKNKIFFMGVSSCVVAEKGSPQPPLLRGVPQAGGSDL